MIQADLTPATEAVTYWTGLYGSYCCWVATVLAAVFGTRALITNLAPPGVEAGSWQETQVMILLQTEGITAIACSVLIFWGLRRAPAAL